MTTFTFDAEKFNAAIDGFSVTSADVAERTAFLTAWYQNEFPVAKIEEWAKLTETQEFAKEQDLMDAFTDWAETECPVVLNDEVVKALLLEHDPSRPGMVGDYVDESIHQEGIRVFDRDFEGDVGKIKTDYDIYRKCALEDLGEE